MEIPGLDGKQASQLLFCTNMILSDLWCASCKLEQYRIEIFDCQLDYALNSKCLKPTIVSLKLEVIDLPVSRGQVIGHLDQ